MKFMAINLIISLLIFISIIGIGVFIQVKLSRSKNKYLGLIMPVISFLLSILVILNMAVFTSNTTTTTEIITTDGVEELAESVEITENLGKDVITLDLAVSMFFIFLVSNIPTVILGGIYLSERNKIDVKKSIEKMKIDDL